MKMRQQDIVWVKLPFSNLEESKMRPAVVVSNSDYNDQNQDVVVCAVTSNLEARKYGVLISQENLASGKLPIKSRIRADKVMQVEKSLIVKPFAAIDDKTFDAVVAELMKLFKRSG